MNALSVRIKTLRKTFWNIHFSRPADFISRVQVQTIIALFVLWKYGRKYVYVNVENNISYSIIYDVLLA